ncbi:hypothetical protein DFQ28_009010 [Apophysomyces sp. BC1034]|nr:hypothetical protein DFQ29_006391 [Apophysomyces sp. BC1021]KAG0185668.1 hypothetical protein DFQ28_009010 [Apophysomyces sp. BC1034]
MSPTRVALIFESITQSDLLLSYQRQTDGYVGSDALQTRKPETSSRNLLSSLLTQQLSESNLVNIGKEMEWMMNRLVQRGVQEPVIGGILVQGFKMMTYKMNLQFPNVYRMVGLSSVTVFGSLQE